MPLDNSGDWASQAQTEPHQVVGGYGVPYWDESWWHKFREARSVRERNQVLTTLVDQMPVKWDTLPQLPFWAPMFNVTQSKYKALVVHRLMATAFILGHHPLAQEDIDLVAHAAAKRAIFDAYSRPFMDISGCVCWAVGFNKYNFPFYKPRPENFNPEIFPSKKFAFATGRRAIVAWHGARLAAWYAAWRFFGDWIGQAVAETRFSTTLLRNKEFNQKITKTGVTVNSLGMPRERPEVRDAYSAEHPPDHDHQENMEQVPQLAQTPYYQRIQQHQQEQKNQRQAQPQQTQQPTSYDHDDDYLFDDASPVAPPARGTSTGSSPVVQTSGSAWDRLRQQAKAGLAQAPGSTTTTTPPTYVRPSQSPSWAERRAVAAGGGEGMSYTYSETDQDKVLAKEQAQREFDAMLERERRGDGSGRGRSF